MLEPETNSPPATPSLPDQLNSDQRQSDDPLSEPSNYWQTAILLFQPAFIRLLDQLRQQLAAGDWQGDYETREVWLEPAENEESAVQILYLLHLKKAEINVQVNLWELCYQICFQDYQPQITREIIADFQPDQVLPDTHLLDANGEVAWHCLDHKAKTVVAELLQTVAATAV